MQCNRCGSEINTRLFAADAFQVRDEHGVPQAVCRQCFVAWDKLRGEAVLAAARQGRVLSEAELEGLGLVRKGRN